MQKLIIQKAVRGFSGAKAVLVLCLLMASSSFAATVDFSPLESAVDAALLGLAAILIAIGAVMVGIHVVPAGFKFIKSMMR